MLEAAHVYLEVNWNEKFALIYVYIYNTHIGVTVQDNFTKSNKTIKGDITGKLHFNILKLYYSIKDKTVLVVTI